MVVIVRGILYALLCCECRGELIRMTGSETMYTHIAYEIAHLPFLLLITHTHTHTQYSHMV